MKKKRRFKINFLHNTSHETKIFLLFVIVCLLIKIALTSWRAIFAIPNALSDDGLMQNSAMSILDLHWFGHFDAYTLSKRNIFPFYLATTSALGIPFLIANEILWFVAVLVIVFLVKKYTNKKWPLYVAFLLLFFNPATFATGVSVRIYRDAILPSLILICLGSLGHIYTNIKDKKPFRGWLTSYAVSLVFFWFLREESIWIVPVLALLTLAIVLIVAKSKEDIRYKRKTILQIFLVPILSVFVVGLGIRTVNFALYGSFVVSEDQSAGFQNFYNAIGRIDSDKKTGTIDLPTDVRNKIYEISPTFATIKDEMENVVVPDFKKHGDDPEEINTGWTSWSLRRAMSTEGYYQDARTANDFYEQVAKDINAACDEGKLECHSHKPGLVETITGNMPWLIGNIFDGIKYSYSFSDTAVKQYYSDPVPMARGEASEILTHENMMSQSVNTQENPGDFSHFTLIDKIKIKILSAIRKVYTIISPVIFWAAVVLFVVFSVRYLFFVKDGKKFYQRPQFGLIVLGVCTMAALILRCLIVGYVSLTAFYAMSDVYMYSCYALVLMFDVIALALTVSAFNGKIQGKVRKREVRRK